MFSASFFVKLLLKALAAAPSIIEDVELAVNSGWGQDHVLQAKKGLDTLNKVFADAAPAVEGILEDAKQEGAVTK